MIREVIEVYNLAPEDILHKMKKKIIDEDLTFNMFKDCIIKIDTGLS